MQGPISAFARILIVVTIGATALAFAPAAADPINIIKLTLLLVTSVVVLAVGAVSVVRTRTAYLPREPILIAVGLFLLGLLLATAVAPDKGTAVLGHYQRNTGLLLFLACIVALMTVLLAFDAAGLELLVRSLLGLGVVLSCYGLAQVADLDPVDWFNEFDPILLTLGNPNFAAAYLGMLVPIAAYGAVRRTWVPGWRAASAVLGIVMFGLAVASDAAQGPLCALVGLAVLAVARLLNAPSRVRRGGLAAVATTAVIGLTVGVAGLFGAGPAGRAAQISSVRARRWYWEAAVEMFGDRPLQGVGLDSYGGFYRAFRPDGAQRALGGSSFTDSAHSVPLSMFAWGGLLLGLAFLAVLAIVGVGLIRGLARHTGERRLLLGAVGGAWAAWVTQGAVSIEQVPLTLLGWVLCGATLVAARPADSTPARWMLRLPGAATGPPTRTGPTAAPRPRGRSDKNPRKSRPAGRRQSRSWTAGDRAAVVVIGVVAVLACWFAVQPLRADLAARRGDQALFDRRADDALAAFNEAISLGPSRGSYWARRGELYERAKQPERALASFLAGVEHDPRTVDVLRPAARLSAQLGHTADAARLYRKLLDVDPRNPLTLTAYATFLMDQKDAGRAVSLLRQATELDGSSADVWRQLGDALRAAGDVTAARDAYQRALAIRADFPEVTRALAALDAER